MNISSTRKRAEFQPNQAECPKGHRHLRGEAAIGTSTIDAIDSICIRQEAVKGKDETEKEFLPRYFIADLKHNGFNKELITQDKGGVYWTMLGNEEHSFIQASSEKYIFPEELFNNEWEMVGGGDFEGYKNIDLLFRHRKTKEIRMFKDVGIVPYIQLKYITPPESINPSEVKGAEIVATCDVNKDKKADILFQREDGTAFAWLMNDNNVLKQVELKQNPKDGSEWHIVGAGHFHGYGTSDLVLQKKDGSTKIELYDGTNFESEHSLYASGKIMGRNLGHYPFIDRIVCVGDVNFDGETDIISTQGDNYHSLYLSIMNGVKEKFCVPI